MNNSTNAPVRIGVIGCGAIAELFHLPVLFNHPRTKNGIALAEPNPTRLAAMKKKFGARQAVTNYIDLLGKVDAVIVATPPHLHYPVAKWFLDHGVHVLCEKPLTESIVEARDLVQTGIQSGAMLAVNQTRRFFPSYQKIRQLIANGTLGKIHSITYHDGMDFNWPAASPHHFQPVAKGTWSDTGVHLLDSVCYWLDATPELVLSQNDSYGGPEAIATVNLVHQNCQVEIKVSRLGRLMNGFRIVGSLGTIEAEAEDWDEFSVLFQDGRTKRYKCASNRLKYVDFAKPLIENLIQVAGDGAVPIVTGASVLGTIELLEEAYQNPKPFPMPWNDHLETFRHDVRFKVDTGRSPIRVLVTGVSGFVGGRVAEAMKLTGIFQPVAAIRNWSRASRVARHPMKIVICDIMNPVQIDEAMAQVDAVVHCAYSDGRESIVQGTHHLLESAAKHGIERFVYVSSAEVYGPNGIGRINENCVLNPLGREYGDAKLEAENRCREYVAKKVYSTILRPSLIYGPFGGSWSMAVAKRLQSGKWGLFDDLGDGIANLVYIDDLVQAIFLGLGRDGTDCQTFNVNGVEQPTWNQYFQRFNHALGLPPLSRISISKSKWRSYSMDLVRKATSAVKARFEDRLMEIYMRGGWAGRMMKGLKGRLDTTPSGSELNDLFARRAIYDDAKIRNELGYLPNFNLDRGIESTIQWMRLHELLASQNRDQITRLDQQSKEPELDVVGS